MRQLGLVGLAGVGVVIAAFEHRKFSRVLEQLIRSRFIWIFFGFAVVVVFCCIGTLEPEYGMRKARKFLFYSGVPLVAITAYGKLGRSDAFWLAVGVCIACLGVGGMLVLNPHTHATMGGSRLSLSPELHPIYVARNIGPAISVLVCYFLYRDGRAWRGLPLLAISGGLLVPLMMTGSRGPLVAATVAIAGTLVLAIQTRAWIRCGTLLICALFGYLVFTQLPLEELSRVEALQRLNLGESAQRIERQLNRVGENSSDDARLERYQVAWDGFVESNYAGVGTGGFLRLWTGAPPGGIETDKDYPHNLFLESAVELGAVGLLLVIGLVLLLASRIFQTVREGEWELEFPIFLSIFLYASANAMVSGDISTNYLFFVSGGLLYGAVLPINAGQRDGMNNAPEDRSNVGNEPLEQHSGGMV